MRSETGDGPKITLTVSTLEATSLRRARPLGVDHVCMGGPALPWTEDQIRERMAALATAGLSLSNMMIEGFPNAIYGRPGRDEDIEKVCQSMSRRWVAWLMLVAVPSWAVVPVPEVTTPPVGWASATPTQASAVAL